MGHFLKSVQKVSHEAPAITEKFIEQQDKFVNLIINSARWGKWETSIRADHMPLSIKKLIIEWLEDEGFKVTELSQNETLVINWSEKLNNEY